MAHPFQITVKETIKELQGLQRKNGELIGKRLLMLIEIKKHEKTGISKRALSDITGINHNSIVKWRNQYNKDGISPLLPHARVGGFRNSILSAEPHTRPNVLFTDPTPGTSPSPALLDRPTPPLPHTTHHTTPPH